MAGVASEAGWDLGAWAMEGARRHGIPVDQAAAEIGISASALHTAVACARRWPPGDRVPDLTVWHHHETISLDREAADAILAEAAEHRWSVARVRQAVRAKRGQPKRGQLALPLELAPTSDSWRRDARRIERSVRQHVKAAAGELAKAWDEIAILADHPGREAAHGNTVLAVVRRLSEWRGTLAAHHQQDLDRALAAIAQKSGVDSSASAGHPSTDAEPGAAPDTGETEPAPANDTTHWARRRPKEKAS